MSPASRLRGSETGIVSQGSQSFALGLTTSAASQLDELFALARWQQLADTEVCKRWWAHMSDLMLTNADNSPVSVELESVFHLD